MRKRRGEALSRGQAGEGANRDVNRGQSRGRKSLEFVEEPRRELRESIGANPLQLLDRFIDTDAGIVGDGVEHRAA